MGSVVSYADTGHKSQEVVYLTGRSLTALPELQQTQELYAAAAYIRFTQ